MRRTASWRGWLERLRPTSPQEAFLRRLRHRLERERIGQFTERLPEGYRVRCRDLLSLYRNYRDIFVRGIYQFQPSGTEPRILDGGAFIGLASLYIKHRWPGARVTAFEADPGTAELLRENLAENGMADIQVIQAALAAEEGSRSFQADLTDGAGLQAEGTEQVECVRLSRFLQEGVEAVKLNIEGAELEVLEESAPLLDHVGELVIEYHGFPELEQSLHRLLEILDRAGFRYLIRPIGGRPMEKPISLTADLRWLTLVVARHGRLMG